MMNYEIFKEVVKEKFMDYMLDNFKGMELVVMPVEKVNMTYDGISIRGKDTNISPTIYINDMYEKYQNCGDLEETLMAACDLMAMEFAKTPQVVDVDSLYKDENGYDDNTYEWVANGIKPEKDNLQNLPPELCANWYRNFQEDKNIVIENLENIREEDSEQYKNLKRQDIHSLVVVPLYWEKKIIGFYGVDNPPAESLDYVSDMLHIMGSFIVSSIRRRNLLRQLERMSYRDQLTQFGNRYAVDWFVEHEWNGEQIGVVYCDITGLKKVNDEQGHEAGDRLIIRACECLAGVFKGYGLYRIGGDEFLVLCLGIEEKDLREHVEKLHMDMKEHQVTMAVGMIWKEHGPKDIDLLLNESERLMYEDKDRYYKEHGLKRRR